MDRRLFLRWVPCALLPAALPATAQSGVVVIGHPGLDHIDIVTLQRIYTGRVVELGGVSLNPANVSAGNPVRARFLTVYLNQDEERYLAYWTVRRYIGKGVPPREFATASEVIRFVQSTPGAIGYIDEANLPPSANVLVR
jgi:hypothetical protein